MVPFGDDPIGAGMAEFVDDVQAEAQNRIALHRAVPIADGDVHRSAADVVALGVLDE